MSKFVVTIKETLIRQITTEAENGWTAKERIHDQWAKGNIKLNEDEDYCDVELDWDEVKEDD